MKYDSVFRINQRETQILLTLNNIEIKAAEHVRSLYQSQLQKFLKSISLNNIQKSEWNLYIPLARALWGLWVQGRKLGSDDANRAMKTKAEFAAARSRSLRNTPAERAIMQRINRLAQDVSNSEFEKMRQHILAAIAPQQETGEPISRNELIKRIQSELGGNSFASRAQTIARTELTFAYNAGRLETYRESGLVDSVKFYTIIDERRCEVCAARHGLIFNLDDAETISANTPPLHPNCRCVLSPVLHSGGDRPQNANRLPQLPPASSWMTTAIIAAILMSGRGSSGRISRAVAVETAAEIIKQATETPARQQQAEPSRTREEEDDDDDIALEELISPAIRRPLSPSTRIRTVPTAPVRPPTEPRNTPVAARAKIMVGAIDLNIASKSRLRQLLVARHLNVRQINEIYKARQQKPFDSLEDLRKVPGIGAQTFARIQQLAEGSEIFIFLDANNIRTPVQLWASNLGLTRPQARIVFEEMQKAPFRDFEDVRKRLQGKGIGQKTIENMKKRAIIQQRNASRIQQSEQQDFLF